MNGIFTISLDFELHWGGCEKWPLDRYRRYFLNTRELIPEMLALFEQYEIHVTWATVGILFHKDRHDLQQNFPTLKPTYRKIDLSPYHYIETTGIGNDEKDDPFHFAPSLIRKILEVPHQELGTHTFAHYYCQEEGQNIDQFRDDLRSAQNAARNLGITLKSLVFPRNQFNDRYLKVCYEEGIVAVRSNPVSWFWNITAASDETLWKRLNRGLDAYLPVGEKSSYPVTGIAVRDDYPVCIPASRFLRPYRPAETFLNYLKIERIKSEITMAAKNGEVYHLWWHPHNFGNYPRESLRDLEKILKHYAYCRDKWRMQSLNMEELAAFVRHEK